MTLISRRLFLGSAPCAALWSSASPAWAQSSATFTPEQFGARGDGVSDDSDAFAALAARVNAVGGGEIQLRRTVYRVGRQGRPARPGSDYSFEPVPILQIRGCTRPVVIRGNGAVLRCGPGMRFGTFDRLSGRPVHRSLPNYRRGELATPYLAMIRIEGCSGPVEISDLELDGNVGQWLIGGPFGDVGRQIHAYGLALYNNRGSERIARVYSHHHGLDGLLIDGFDGPRPVGSLIEQSRFEYNGRQGCSLVGGRGYDFRDCRFAHTGKSKVSSPPGAGVDIEAEGGKRVRNLSFVNCAFVDNSGPGLIADSGDSEGASFAGCSFIGTTSWSAWPNRPGFRFSGCNFVGALSNAFGHADPGRAARFEDCVFKDDPALSPTGQVYGGENRSRPIADLSTSRNVRFDRCRFELTRDSVLPWSTAAIYGDCQMRQTSALPSYPRGTYEGRTVIAGPAQLGGSTIRGEVILNGRLLRGRI
ncbi:MAG TPA: right-handed parallel beta-helix repeat-containing protein [Sphingomicrobium sp.]|nr:right-handed parallel beta-helix repeat-containing protein [Sphingomicrobium sp.]